MVYGSRFTGLFLLLAVRRTPFTVCGLRLTVYYGLLCCGLPFPSHGARSVCLLLTFYGLPVTVNDVHGLPLTVYGCTDSGLRFTVGRLRFFTVSRFPVLRISVCRSPFVVLRFSHGRFTVGLMVYGLPFAVHDLWLKLMSAARVKQAEKMAEQQRTLKERAERAQRQRRAAAAAKKAARDKRTESQARARLCRYTVKAHHERIENFARRTDDDLDHL